MNKTLLATILFELSNLTTKILKKIGTFQRVYENDLSKKNKIDDFIVFFCCFAVDFTYMNGRNLFVETWK